MPSTKNVLDEARELVEKRLADLDEERKRLERALAELGGKVIRRSPGRPRGSKSTPPPRARPPLPLAAAANGAVAPAPIRPSP